jgi:hypothetical protein
MPAGLNRCGDGFVSKISEQSIADAREGAGSGWVQFFVEAQRLAKLVRERSNDTPTDFCDSAADAFMLPVTADTPELEASGE